MRSYTFAKGGGAMRGAVCCSITASPVTAKLPQQPETGGVVLEKGGGAGCPEAGNAGVGEGGVARKPEKKKPQSGRRGGRLLLLHHRRPLK